MRKLFFLLGIIVPFLRADPVITTSVSCQSYGAAIITAQSSCSEGGPIVPNTVSPSYAFASSTASVTLQQVATDWLTISFQNSVNTVDGAPYLYEHGQLPANQNIAPGVASGEVSVHIDAYTLGPVRPGILQVQWSPIWMSNPGDFVAAAGYTIHDPLLASAVSCVTADANCNGPGPHAPPIPFQLGTDFSFDGSASLFTSSGDGNSYGYDGMLLKFRFLEADGVTPVLSYDPPAEAPEPATWGLSAFAGIGVFLSAKRRATSAA
jgi:hypothetical protein